MGNNSTIILLKKISVWVLSFVLFFFPLLFLVNATDPFLLPKQVFLVMASVVLLILWSVIMVFEKKIMIRTSPFNLPAGLFTLAVLISAFLSRNMYDSLALAIPVLASFILYFVAQNTISNKKDLLFVLSALLLGGAVSSLISVLYYLKIYFLPIPAIQSQYFTTFGSPIQHIIYIVPLLIVAAYFLSKEVRGRKPEANYNTILFGGLTGTLLISAVLLIVQVVTAPQKPLLLPYTFGFQIATAAISQDTTRFLISLPFGSGFGTFLSDFTRFKLPDINNGQLWAASFSTSSSFVLELLTTVGVVGLLTYLFMIAKVLKNRTKDTTPLFFALLVVFLVSFFLPLSIISLTLIFILMALFTSTLFLDHSKNVYDISLSIVALKHGLFSIEETSGAPKKASESSKVLPIIVALVIILVGGYTGYLSFKLLSADMKMADSLSQSKRNNGQAIYDLQRQALIDFPYRSDYYRIFSQINLALANSIAGAVPQGSTPSTTAQATITQLLQQSIANGRTAVALAPMSSVNWENLSQIYRSLIGVGQNAGEFSVATMNQAIILDPSNPLLRVELGGIYYQLQQYDAAQNQFQIAINLKPDFANAYYNLGHALEAKGDLRGAITAYQAAQSLTTNDNDKKRLDSEMEVILKKIGTEVKPGTQPSAAAPSADQPPLGISTPSAQLPSQKDQVKLPSPPTETQPTATPKTTK
ncbi:MAG: tetratricopeptide repeat protein [Candidatus Levyibacteriota bacterium]